MRNTIVNLIHERAKSDSGIYFLTGDLGYSVVDNFMKEFPDRCLNLGIAEQNMMGAAAGLALEGKKVFVYSITPFVTMRCMEQIRTDVALQNLDVTIIGVGGGFAYGTLGPTHHAIEDIAMMRAIPNMKVVAPSDPASAAVLGRQILDQKGPWFLHLNKGGEPVLYPKIPYMKIGKAFVAKTGKQVSILASGAVAREALEAAELLDKAGIGAEVADVATIKPLDVEFIKDRLKSRRLVVTVEENNLLGGFGSAVAEVAAEFRGTAAFRRLGIDDRYSQSFGSQAYMRKLYGLSGQQIFETVKKIYGKL
jgi:transketolase